MTIIHADVIRAETESSSSAEATVKEQQLASIKDTINTVEPNHKLGIKHSGYNDAPLGEKSDYFVTFPAEGSTTHFRDLTIDSFNESVLLGTDSTGKLISYNNVFNDTQILFGLEEEVSVNKVLAHIWNSTTIKDSGFELTENGDGTFNIAQGNVFLIQPDSTGMNYHHINQLVNISIPDNDTSYIYAYIDAGGIAQISHTTDLGITHTPDNNILYIITRVGTELNVLPVGDTFDNFMRKYALYSYHINGFKKAFGSALSINASHQINLTAGEYYFINIPFDTPALDTSTTGTFTYIYSNGSGGWTRVPSSTAIDYNHYDNGTGTLGLVANNKYSIAWLYCVHNTPAHYAVLYGDAEYNTEQEALDAGERAIRPPELTDESTGDAIYKIIYTGDGTLHRIIDLGLTPVGSSVATNNHNELTNLQGGNVGQYYHLTSDELNDVQNIVSGKWTELNGELYPIIDPDFLTLGNPISPEGKIDIHVSETVSGDIVVTGTEDGTGPNGIGNADGVYTYTGATSGQMSMIYQRGTDNVFIGRVTAIWIITNVISPGYWTDGEYYLNAGTPIGTAWEPVAGSGNTASPNTESATVGNSLSFNTNGDIRVGNFARVGKLEIDNKIGMTYSSADDNAVFDLNGNGTFAYDIKANAKSLMTIQNDGSASLPSCPLSAISFDDDITTKEYVDQFKSKPPLGNFNVSDGVGGWLATEFYKQFDDIRSDTNIGLSCDNLLTLNSDNNRIDIIAPDVRVFPNLTTGEFLVGGNSTNALIRAQYDTISTLTSPLLTSAGINAGGDKSLITKEYFETFNNAASVGDNTYLNVSDGAGGWSDTSMYYDSNSLYVSNPADTQFDYVAVTPDFVRFSNVGDNEIDITHDTSLGSNNHQLTLTKAGLTYTPQLDASIATKKYVDDLTTGFKVVKNYTEFADAMADATVSFIFVSGGLVIPDGSTTQFAVPNPSTDIESKHIYGDCVYLAGSWTINNNVSGVFSGVKFYNCLYFDATTAKSVTYTGVGSTIVYCRNIDGNASNYTVPTNNFKYERTLSSVPTNAVQSYWDNTNDNTGGGVTKLTETRTFGGAWSSNTNYEFTQTVTGANVGDDVIFTVNSSLYTTLNNAGSSFDIRGYVSATNTVTFNIRVTAYTALNGTQGVKISVLQ